MNIDGDTDTADVDLFNSGYGTSTCTNPAPLTAAQFARADFDGDCDIDLSDLGVYYSCSVVGWAQPTTLASAVGFSPA